MTTPIPPPGPKKVVQTPLVSGLMVEQAAQLQGASSRVSDWKRLLAGCLTRACTRRCSVQVCHGHTRPIVELYFRCARGGCWGRAGRAAHLRQGLKQSLSTPLRGRLPGCLAAWLAGCQHGRDP